MLVDSKEFVNKLKEMKVSTSVIHILAGRLLNDRHVLAEKMKQSEGMGVFLCFAPEELNISVGLFDVAKSMQDKENIFTDVFPVLKLVGH